jgi:hypothetical protein
MDELAMAEKILSGLVAHVHRDGSRIYGGPEAQCFICHPPKFPPDCPVCKARERLQDAEDAPGGYGRWPQRLDRYRRLCQRRGPA